MLPLSTRVFVCTEAQDMRRSFDRLAQEVREHVGENPQDGALFVFVSKRGTRVKVLWWERNGYCLLYKRLHRALFVMPIWGGIRSRGSATLPGVRSLFGGAFLP